MKVLLFTGAGASVELGISAMRKMAEQFRDHLHDLSLPEDIVEKMDKLVGDETKDMEDAIDIIDRLESGFTAKVDLGENPDEAEIAPFLTIRQEAEWFVQHCCEQIKAESAIRMWSPTLRAANEVDLTIASTNYDRAVEITAARLSVNIEDGFEDFGASEYAAYRGFVQSDDMHLYKLHGLTDWYRTGNGEVFKLRHPMPLFGKLQITPEKLDDKSLHSALILPSREKAITQPPFQSIASEFRQKAKETDFALFLGSSLRDPHMREVCRECAINKPTFVISQSGNFEDGILPEPAVVIRQGASRFLMTTFPQFLREQDTAVLHDAAKATNPDNTRILDWLNSAYDESLSEKLRCDSMETLADAGISLHHDEVMGLLKSSSDDVSIYALGLVITAYNRDRLLQEAGSIAASRPNSKFNIEVSNLRDLLQKN